MRCHVSLVKVRVYIGTAVEEENLTWESGGFLVNPLLCAMRGGACTVRILATVTEIYGKEINYVEKPKPRNASQLGIISERHKILRMPYMFLMWVHLVDFYASNQYSN